MGDGGSSVVAVRRLMALFGGSRKAHGTHGLPVWNEAKGKWSLPNPGTSTLQRRATERTWAQHLAGKRPLGVILVDEHGCASCIMADVDEYSRDLTRLAGKIEDLKLPLVPIRSKSGGMHLALFVDGGIPVGEPHRDPAEWTDALASLAEGDRAPLVALLLDHGRPSKPPTFDVGLADALAFVRVRPSRARRLRAALRAAYFEKRRAGLTRREAEAALADEFRMHPNSVHYAIRRSAGKAARRSLPRPRSGRTPLPAS